MSQKWQKTVSILHYLSDLMITNYFYARRYASAVGLYTVVCPSVPPTARPSVCLSNAGIVSIPLNQGVLDNSIWR